MSKFDAIRKNLSNNKNYLSQVRAALEGKEVKPEDGFGVDKKELEQDVLTLKKEGYTLDEIHQAIDDLEEIKNKDGAKKFAKDTYDKKAEIVIIRHGTTKLNSISEDKIRGWADIPLDEQGKKEAKKTGEELKGQNIDGLVVSDMGRTKETAEIISKESDIPILEETKAFRPWDVGKYTGQATKDVLPILEKQAREHPDTPVDGGESFNEFKDRFLKGIEKVQNDYPGEKIGIVTHHRGDRVMAAWEKIGMPKNLDIDLDTFFEKGIKPGDWRSEGENVRPTKEVPK